MIELNGEIVRPCVDGSHHLHGFLRVCGVNRKKNTGSNAARPNHNICRTSAYYRLYVIVYKNEYIATGSIDTAFKASWKCNKSNLFKQVLLISTKIAKLTLAI